MAQTLLGNVKGPKGDTGAQGPQGEQGPTGAQGPQGETGPANTAFITDAFSTSQAYNAGDYCIYNNTLYRFTENKTAGEWDDSKVTSTLIGTELSGLNSRTARRFTYTVQNGQTLSLTDNLPSAYICATNGNVATALSVVVGSGYAYTSSRHNIAQLIESPSIIYAANDTVYGLKITNNTGLDITVGIIAII